jgi:Family of unknown function (DUF6105)
MRYLIVLWISPLAAFWGWYFLSLNDINFGYVMLSRRLHDLVFQLYGEMLGVDPNTIPGLLARACIFDTFLVGCLIAFRRRKAIVAWVRAQREALVRHLAQNVKPVQHTLQDEGGGGGVDFFGALFTRKIHFNQRAFGRDRRQPLVPE